MHVAEANLKFILNPPSNTKCNLRLKEIYLSSERTICPLGTQVDPLQTEVHPLQSQIILEQFGPKSSSLTIIAHGALTISTLLQSGSKYDIVHNTQLSLR